MSDAGRPAAAPPDLLGRLLLGLASLAVAFAAADTYVVVLALPEMMTAGGLSGEELQRAAPIISGFMLGYVGALPLVGRIADLRGRTPVLVGSLVLFALGSMVTAAAYDLDSLVAGRVLQGIGGGGLLPATLALVADLYPPHRRGVPLGVVNAVQEMGNVIGPLYGAVVLTFGSWRDIFWLNLAGALVLAAVIRRASRALPDDAARPARRYGPPDLLSVGLVTASLLALLALLRQPAWLTESVVWGWPLVPLGAESRWLSPLALLLVAMLLLVGRRGFTAARPLLDLRGWRHTARRVDLLGAGLLATALACVILAFATADPQVQVFSPAGVWLLLIGAVAAVAFWRRNASVAHALIPNGAITATPAWGALVVSFFVGAALIAALVDIPVFARITIHGDSQLAAAMVLVRFLIGLPVGAFLGGLASRHLPAGVVTAAGMALSSAGFLAMSQWGLEALRSPWATVPLVAAGLGVGLAMAPTNAALLAATDPEVHGIAAALLVVARTIGKLVGVSALTTIGLRRYYAAESAIPSPAEVCEGGRTRCAEFTLLLREAGLVQLHTIFLGAAVCCVIAALTALVVYRHAATRVTDDPADPTAGVAG